LSQILVIIKPGTYESCNCPSECETTTYAISESTRPILDFQEFCDDNTFIREYVDFIIANYKLKFVFDYFINENGPSPERLTGVCQFLMKNHVSIIRVELASKSAILSVRDKRITFENQLAALGERKDCPDFDDVFPSPLENTFIQYLLSPLCIIFFYE
jgi:hypothetical protein